MYKGTYLGTVVAVKKLFRTAYTTVEEVKAQFEHEVKVLKYVNRFAAWSVYELDLIRVERYGTQTSCSSWE